jgi:hypothetical protein
MLRDIMQHAPEHALSARRLIDLALWCGGHDNASLALASFSRESWNTLPPLQLDVIEVWDSYGDAKFFGVSRYYHRKNTQSSVGTDLVEASGSVNRENEVPVRPLDKLLESKRLANASLNKSGNPVSQAIKRKKPPKKKVSQPDEMEKKIDPVPQLTINFRKKD